MILKLLLIIGVISIVYFLFIKKSPQKNNTTSTRNQKKQADVDDMIECASCGVYVALNEALLSEGRYYCSKECLQKGI